MTIKIDDKGRLVLPKEARERLGLRQGVTLKLEYRADGIILHPQKTMAIEDLYGIAKTKKPIRVEDIEEASSGGALT